MVVAWDGFIGYQETLWIVVLGRIQAKIQIAILRMDLNTRRLPVTTMRAAVVIQITDNNAKRAKPKRRKT